MFVQKPDLKIHTALFWKYSNLHSRWEIFSMTISCVILIPLEVKSLSYHSTGRQAPAPLSKTRPTIIGSLREAPMTKYISQRPQPRGQVRPVTAEIVEHTDYIQSPTLQVLHQNLYTVIKVLKCVISVQMINAFDRSYRQVWEQFRYGNDNSIAKTLL